MGPRPRPASGLSSGQRGPRTRIRGIVTHTAPQQISPCVVVMGVSGTGKSTTARLLAERLGLPFADADDLHPRANIIKMTSGVPLDDADRGPWLAAVGRWLRARHAAGTGGVIACSALKHSYRDILRAAVPDLFFLLLTADREELCARIAARGHHFMPVELLDSQLAALEPLNSDERGLTVHSRSAPEAVDIVTEVLRRMDAPDSGK
ncbi:MAG: gluconokinase [Nocardia sp.]|nr:gluconokinase [Nocardia sp.]